MISNAGTYLIKNEIKGFDRARRPLVWDQAAPFAPPILPVFTSTTTATTATTTSIPTTIPMISPTLDPPPLPLSDAVASTYQVEK